MALLGLGAACQESAAEPGAQPTFLRPVLIDEEAAPVPGAASSLRAPAREPLLGQWCERAGEDGTEQLRATARIAATYLAEQRRACAALTSGWSPEQLTLWQEYLALYTQVMAGCERIAEPPPDGIRAFGLANVVAVGSPPPALSEADVRLLIGLYVWPFAASLLLTEDESVVLDAHLWRTAAPLFESPSSAPGICLPVQGDDG